MILSNWEHEEVKIPVGVIRIVYTIRTSFATALYAHTYNACLLCGAGVVSFMG